MYGVHLKLTFKLKKIFFCIFFGLATLSAHAKEQFLYSGFAFSGNYSNRETLYPYTSKIDTAKLDSEFLQRLKKDPAIFNKLLLEQGKAGQGTQISVAFALNSETAEYQVVDGVGQIIIRIYATVLAFDRESKSLVAAYPFGVGTTVTVTGRPNTDLINEMIRKIYFTNEYGVNAFDQWIARFNQVTIKPKFARYLQVKNIEFEPEAQTVLSANRVPEVAFKNQIGNWLDAAISSENNVPILPSTVGEAVGGKMAYRFSNATSFDLKLPEPDYEITFTIRAFRSKVTEESSATVGIYRALATIKVDTNAKDFNKKYLDERIYDTIFIRVPRGSSVSINVMPQYKKALFQLITGLSKQFNKVDSEWLENSAANGAKARANFNDTVQLFNSLR